MPPVEADQAPEQVQDTPNNSDAAPEEGHAAPVPATDYQERYEGVQKRYDDLVPEYTRGQQLIAAARGDHGPEAQMQALQMLGVDVQQEEPENESWDDPTDRLAREMAELKQDLASRDEKDEVARFKELEREYIDTTLGELESKEGIKLNEKAKRFIENDALSNRLEDGRPDLEGAVQNLIDIRNEDREGYLASKKASVAPVGSAGEKAIDLSKMSKDEKDQWMVEDLEARAAAEGS